MHDLYVLKSNSKNFGKIYTKKIFSVILWGSQRWLSPSWRNSGGEQHISNGEICLGLARCLNAMNPSNKSKSFKFAISSFFLLLF